MANGSLILSVKTPNEEAWKKERENIGDKYMKVHNLGKEIDNLHKNIVNVEDKRGIETSARLQKQKMNSC